MKPIRIQRRRTKGWVMPENTVYVGRPSWYGNPFFSTPDGITAQGAVDKYKNWIRAALGEEECRTGVLFGMLESIGGYPIAKKLISKLPNLRGKNLACWCHLDQPCHADVLLELANQK